MRVLYYEETDTLSLELVLEPAVETRELAPGIVADFTADGRLAGLDIDLASTVVELETLEVVGFPKPISLSA